MPLTDTAIQKAKPGPKPAKMSDEKGLFLLVQPSGGKLWRLKYRIDGREQKLSLGTYPEVSLKDARRRRDEARSRLADGIDPAAAKKASAAAKRQQSEVTFGALGREYLDRAEREGRAAVTIKKSRWLLSLLETDLEHKPIATIKPAELLETIRKVEAKGHLETARRMRSLAGRVFRYAVATSRADADPTALLKG
ncbi:MAG: Arm DNA-binding domain-containing protein, partial [Sphingomonadales bacterium]|nr:Arm DNA-binding domain-containing protein [Sphingomonadales bacterium]